MALGDRIAIGILALLALAGPAALALWFFFMLLLEGLSQQTREHQSPCREVDADAVVARIEANLTIPGGGRLRGARLELSEISPGLGLLTADVQGAGYEGDHDIGLWRISEESTPIAGTFEAANPIHSVNALAGEVSGFPFSAQYLQTGC